MLITFVSCLDYAIQPAGNEQRVVPASSKNNASSTHQDRYVCGLSSLTNIFNEQTFSLSGSAWLQNESSVLRKKNSHADVMWWDDDEVEWGKKVLPSGKIYHSVDMLLPFFLPSSSSHKLFSAVNYFTKQLKMFRIFFCFSFKLLRLS